jgi:hypothetical protein
MITRMRRTLTIATASVLLAGLAACSNSKTGTTTADKPTALSGLRRKSFGG